MTVVVDVGRTVDHDGHQDRYPDATFDSGQAGVLRIMRETTVVSEIDGTSTHLRAYVVALYSAGSWSRCTYEEA